MKLFVMNLTIFIAGCLAARDCFLEGNNLGGLLTLGLAVVMIYGAYIIALAEYNDPPLRGRWAAGQLPEPKPKVA